MTDVAKRGDVFLLYVGDGGTVEAFTKIAGIRPTSMKINGKTVDVSNKDTGGWQALLTGGGIRSIAIDIGGVFYAAATQLKMRTLAASAAVCNFQLHDGHTIMECAFQVTSYEQQGQHDNEQSFTATLESAGVPSFDTASDH